MSRTIERYVFRELMAPLFLSLWIFTLVLLMRHALEISDLLMRGGVRPGQVVLLLVYALPSLLWFSIPLSFLVAALITLGRLSADNEITAMRAVGMGTAALLRPLLAAGAVLSLACLAVGIHGIPTAAAAARGLAQAMLRQSATAGLQAGVFDDRFPDLVFYAEEVAPHGTHLEGILVADYRTTPPETILAAAGSLAADPEGSAVRMTLRQGSIHQADPSRGVYRLIRFDTYTLSLDQAVSTQGRPEATEMTLQQLRTMVRNSPPSRARQLAVHYHERFALPLACMVFALFAIPFGTGLRRSGKVAGFGWGLLILFLYYLLLAAGRNLGAQGVLPPPAAAWLPNAVFTAAGLLLLVRSGRRIPDRGIAGMLLPRRRPRRRS